MDLDKFSLFLKMVAADYALSPADIEKVSGRLLADEAEFFKTWDLYQNREVHDGVDDFKPILEDLLI
ncbi:MAG TPA: hypothetical protein VKY27_02470 [Bacteriovoracaceae bacterium]|nr:hypothetical protein [Bacteriovoracaceae bacterium]